MSLYDFRHLNATFMLNLGIAPAEIAARLGHSVDVLLSVYAGVMTGDRERANAAIEKALAVPSRPALSVVA
jgi:integrase